MKNTSTIIASALLLLCGVIPTSAQNAGGGTATPQGQGKGVAMEYKMISGFKQPFNEDLKYQTSMGWIPVGGVSVTTWNNDLYFAQLLGKPAGSGQ